MMNRTLIGIFLLTLFANASWADDVRQYFVAPLSTELHRATVSSTADTYAIVNCNALVSEDELDSSRFDEKGFVSALSDLTVDRGSVLMVCRYQFPVEIEEPLRKRISQRLEQLCRSAGYENVTVSETHTSADWAKTCQRAVSFNQPDDAQEQLIENEHVRFFPMRTQLSKWVHGSADCIVEVIRPVDGRMKEISSGLESSIRQAVQQAQLGEKKTMMFKLSSTTAGREAVERLFDSRSAPKIPETDNAELRKFFEKLAADFKPSPALSLAQDLGFQSIIYSHSSGGGAPETLVGKEAPNFELPSLKGDPLNLHDFIRGRPALITFWGLACGPCRKEAPYLSEMYKEYGQRLAIVAINGYDDGREAVARYVKNEELVHPMVLNGKTASDDLYHVGRIRRPSGSMKTERS
jgi:thiol-disulfide isomerase/thioredoxin